MKVAVHARTEVGDDIFKRFHCELKEENHAVAVSDAYSAKQLSHKILFDSNVVHPQRLLPMNKDKAPLPGVTVRDHYCLKVSANDMSSGGPTKKPVEKPQAFKDS
jgi:hypothetical protein